MTQVATLCVATHCRIRRQHTQTCTACTCGEPARCRAAEHCDGCQPRRAADGLYLCDLDTRRLAVDARTAGVLHEALALTLIQFRPGGERRSSGDGAPVPNGEVMEARSAIRTTLVAMARVIADERGFAHPGDDVRSLVQFVIRSHRWLAAHRAAREHAQDVRDLATDHRTWRLAYPSGTDRLYIGDCPRPRDDGATCGSRLYQKADHGEITCPGCGYTDVVEWWQQRIVGEAQGVVDAYAIAAYLSMRWKRPVDPGTVSKWAQRGHIARHGQDGRMRTLYDLDECRTYATRIWGAGA